MNIGKCKFHKTEKSAVNIQELYAKWPDIYELFAKDRDFKSQVTIIKEIAERRLPLQKISKSLELFAGPAYHARLLDREHDILITCIDSSIGMKQLAETLGVEAKSYMVGVIPEDIPILLKDEEKFDLVLVFRYSIGYLNPEELLKLFTYLRPHMQRGGSIFLELHSPQNICSGFNNLEIRKRSVFKGKGEKITCIWPAGQIRFCESAFDVEMDVEIDREYNGCIEKSYFISREHIYTATEIKSIVMEAGGYYMETEEDVALKSIFPDSSIVSVVVI